MNTPAKKSVPSLSDLKSNKNKDTDTDTDTDTEAATPTEAPAIEKDSDNFLSPAVVSTVPNKTPAELASETPDEAAARYGIKQEISDRDADDPQVQVYRDDYVKQIPSGTHLHPDIAKDLLNRGISEHRTDNAQIRRNVNAGYDFAEDAPYNDKFQKPETEEEVDREEEYRDGDVLVTKGKKDDEDYKPSAENLH